MKAMKKNYERGFTLIELMVTIAIIGVIAAIALPSYSQFIIKSRRTDAKVELLRLAQLQESYFIQNLSYARSFGTGAGRLGITPPVYSENEFYQFRFAQSGPAGCNGTASSPCTSYRIDGWARKSQAKDRECYVFTLDNVGRKMAKVHGGSATVEHGKKCW